MFSSSISSQLRARGHDVVAVTERPELRSLSDEDVFAAAQRERRVVVTENIPDFSRIASIADQAGQLHFGIFFVRHRQDPRGRKRTLGRLVKEMDELLSDHPGDDRSSRRYWL
jgi:hypothetical protein